MMKDISTRVAAHFLSITLLSCSVEGRCKCVNYDRDWYVVVCSFASGLVIAALLACLLNWYCRRCEQVRHVAADAGSREALEMQNRGDFNPFYEELPDQRSRDDTSEETGIFKPQLGSDSMESQISVFEFHGESSNLGDYQHPRPADEPIYNNCGGIDGGNDGASGLQEHGWGSECDASTGIGSYQHPRLEPTAFEPELYENQQEISRKDQVSLPGNYQEPKPTYNGCTQDSRSPLPSRPKVALTKPPRYTKPQSKSREPKGPPHYQTPSLPDPTPRTSDQTPASKSSQPPSDYNQPKEYTNVSSENAKNLGDCEATEFVSSIDIIPTATSISQPSSPKMSQNQSNQQFQEMDIKFPESKNIQGEPREEMKRASSYQLPEIDFEFLQSKNNPSCSSSSRPTPPPSPNIAPPSSLPSALPSKTPSPGIPTARSTVVLGSSPPDSPSEPLPVKSPVIPTCSMTKPVGPPIPPKMKSADSQVPPPLPSKTPPPNSPEISLQSTPCSQQISLQSTPPSFPSNTTPSPPSSATTKPSSAPSSSLYAELNELDRRDDTEDYQHLTSMTKQ